MSTAMPPLTTQTARQRLGEVIRFHRENRQITLRDVSRRARCSVADIERWETGAIVPTGEQWKALGQGIHRSLHAYNELRLRALAEQDAERNAITKGIAVHAINGRNGTTNSSAIVTNLGDKLAAVQPLAQTTSSARSAADSPSAQIEPARVDSASAQIEPARVDSASAQIGVEPRGFAADGRRLSPAKPAGSMTDEAKARRRQFVRDMLVARPNARTSGADSVIEAVRRAFGIGINPSDVESIRTELEREKLRAEVRAEMQTPDLPQRALARLEIERPTPTVTKAAEINHADLEAAVQLVLGAVPGLQTFTISVDETGEASVDYQVREVQIRTVGGSLKVRR